ncbi:phosphatase [Chlorella sorokiniana]|uniref:Phosphatase n=1 Tax=Chlorella sorokiniana TaxID=3076 RepID=A0A2P6TX93_CHLSO|nr:phosphatase [Chlorella sorokiniana]|eukprot:PRW58680.1 phosphatase [Chlorella sorokiniana]
MQPLLAAAMAALSRPALDRLMEGWTAAAAERPPGFDSQASLALPGFAEAAVVSRGGRMSNRWKSENQDAFLLELLGSTAGTAGAAGTAGTADIAAGAAGAVSAAAQRQGPLLVGVLDGHGVGGQTASRVAADGIAAELAQRLGRSGGSSTDGSGSDSSSRDASCTSSSSSSAPSQQALVESFQRVAARMQADDAFREGGTAAVVCLVERGSITCAWAGDCRAVAGLSLEGPGGPAFVVHPLTQDHKPDSPQELARVVASGLGRVVRFSPGAPPRLCGMGNPNTLALSRALGDNWALPMGLTAEPDAVTMALPPPAPGAFAQLADDALAGSGGIDSLSTDTEEEESSGAGSSSSGSGTDGSTGSSSGSGGSGNDSGGAAQVAAARHVLLVACDGLWDYVTNQEAVDIALRHDSADAAALALADTARRRWAAAYSGEFVDDITAAVCFIR